MGQSLSQLYVHLICSTKQYIEQQETHHSATSFQEEYRRFLQLYEVEYDERYVWD
jgi:putative transposase